MKLFLIFSILFLLIGGPVYGEESICDITTFLKSIGREVDELESGENGLSKEVAILWYPKTYDKAITHTELLVGRTLYNPMGGHVVSRTLSKAEQSARNGTKGFFKFQLKVTDAEFAKLEKFMAENVNQDAFQTCVSGACSAITQNTGIIIPLPFTQIPTLNAIYFSVLNKLGYKRILKIEYIGKDAISNLISTNVVGELVIAGVAGAAATTIAGVFVVTALNYSGEQVNFIIPLSK